MDDAQDGLHDGLPKLSIGWISDTTLIEAPLPAKRLLENYAHVPSDEIMAHLHKVVRRPKMQRRLANIHL
jgi:hypothetical protein